MSIDKEKHIDFEALAEYHEKGAMYVPPRQHQEPPTPVKRWREDCCSRGQAYLRLFEGDYVKKSEILLQTPYMKITLDILIDGGHVKGLQMFNEDGTQEELLFMPDKQIKPGD